LGYFFEEEKYLYLYRYLIASWCSSGAENFLKILVDFFMLIGSVLI